MAWFWIVAALAAAWCERIWLKFLCGSPIWFSYCFRFQNVRVRGTKMTTKTVFSECLQVSKPSRISHHLVDICFFEAMPMRLLRLLRNLPHSQRKAQLRNQKLLSWEVLISNKFQWIAVLSSPSMSERYPPIQKATASCYQYVNLRRADP